MYLLVFLYIANLFIAASVISDSFRSFLQVTYGTDTAEIIARDDMGIIGSFGGGNHTSGTKTKKRPVILVHGVTNTAGTLAPIAMYFREKGYADEELYATTYGFSGTSLPMECAFVKQIRVLIVAVARYAARRVKVIAYSMGGPISRKAILGGKCVDTDEELGDPMTDKVHSYLTVAGANRGALCCEAAPTNILCNMLNGMHCSSSFIRDTNSKESYEGRNVYVLQSLQDETVGYMTCGVKSTQLPGSRRVVTTTGYSHAGLLLLTPEVQYDLIANNDS